MRRADAEAFCAEFTRETRAASGCGAQSSASTAGGGVDEACAWIIGDVAATTGERSARILPDARLVEVRHTPNPAPQTSQTQRQN